MDKIPKEDIYKRYWNEILFSNYRMLKVISLCIGIVSLLVFAAGNFFTYTESGMIFYAGWFLSSLLVWILCREKESWMKGKSVFFVYCYASILFILSVINGTFVNKNGISVVVLGLLLLLPTIILDRIQRFHIFQAVLCIIFCVASLLSKPVSFAVVDCFNAMGFSVLAIAVGNMLIKMKLSEIHSRAEIIRQRDTDMLTELLVRQAAEEKIKVYLSERTNMAALYLIDVDNFKKINDTFGHQYGDDVLRDTAAIINSTFSRVSCKARWGGDEFLVFVPDIQSYEEIQKLAQQINVTFYEELRENEKYCEKSVSIGVTIYTGTQTLEELFLYADRALYLVKYSGRNNYHISQEC